MTPPHERLRPHRPLDPGDSLYVPRGDGAPRIVKALQGSPVVGVVGPTGVGKSTELAQVVATLRQAGRPAAHVPLDRHHNMRALTVDQLYVELASAVRGRRLESTSTTFRNELLLAMREARGRPVLVVDGLEKAPPSHGHALLEALGELAAEADVVAVVPWYGAYGPTAMQVMADQERILALRALDPSQNANFLRQLATNRLGFLEWFAFDDLLRRAIPLSGGLPRTFLQLLADAIVYGANEAGLASAVRDQQDSLRRSLLPGDADAIRHAEGTDGREIELDRRVRLMASGLLLEREVSGKVALEPHPLLRGLLG